MLVQSELEKLLSKGIIKKTFHEQIEHVSPIFITPKSDGGIRIILNLKNLNKCIKFQHFKMHTIKDVLQLIRKDCFMISIDLKDAYHSIKIRDDLKFSFKNQLYKYVFSKWPWTMSKKVYKTNFCANGRNKKKWYSYLWIH